MLIILLAGIAWLVKVYHIAATDPGAAGYQSVLSMLMAAVAGKGVFYYVTIASILLVLSLSANTAFADLPRLCRIIALDGYLPRSLANRGRRLVFSEGIFVLTALTGVLLILFGGVTDRLDSALCRGSVPGLHALAIGHGVSLETRARPARRALHVYQRTGRAGYRNHGAGGAGREIHRWRLDHRAS